MSSDPNQLTAEQRFRKAFERLKADKPKVMPPGSPVTQNNIAKEAGCDPSALRKSRFPSLIREIQAYVAIHQEDRPSQRLALLKQRKANRDHRARLEEVVQQRDVAQSQLLSANRRIVELSEQVRLLRTRLEEVKPSAKPIRL